MNKITRAAAVAVTGAALTAGAVMHASPASACSTDADCAHNVAPTGYRYAVATTPGGYWFKNARTEDSYGVWNAATRGNHQGVSFVRTYHAGTVYLGINDHRQGDTPRTSDGLVAWRGHGLTRVDHNRVTRSEYGFVKRVSARVTVKVHGHARRFYVWAQAIWPRNCYCED